MNSEFTHDYVLESCSKLSPFPVFTSSFATYSMFLSPNPPSLGGHGFVPMCTGLSLDLRVDRFWTCDHNHHYPLSVKCINMLDCTQEVLENREVSSIFHSKIAMGKWM